MKKRRLIGKFAVLACSVLLLGGYVFVRAGGKLWPTATDNAPPHEEPMFFSGSKSLQLGPALSVQPLTEDAERDVIMVGSKSGIVFEPGAAAPKASATGESARSAPQRSAVTGGSKDDVVLPVPASQPAPPAQHQARARRSQP